MADGDESIRSMVREVLLNDWDRHSDQYLWARFDSAGANRWFVAGEHESVFFVKMTGGRISFETGPDGRATSLIMRRADREPTSGARLS